MAVSDEVQTARMNPRDVSGLVAEYAASWRRALDSVELPRPEAFLQFVDSDSQADLRAQLDSVDEEFRRLLLEVDSQKTRPNWADETFPGPVAERGAPPAGDNSRPRAPDSPSAELPSGDAPAGPSAGTQPNWTDGTVIGRISDESPDAAAEASARTTDFDHRAAVPRQQKSEVTADFAPRDLRAVAGSEAGQPAEKATDEARLAQTVLSNPVNDEAASDDLSWEKGPASGSRAATVKKRLPEIPGYEIVDILGRGGMGVVYRARQTGLKRLVALKMILMGDHADTEHITRFKTEAEAVAHLQHPNIVQIFDIGTSNGLPYFSLEYIDGQSLEHYREGKPLPAAEAAGIVATLARAMHHAHERGIVHRDLKPSNVLLTSGGVPKITDFGLVKRVEGDSSETRTGSILGTPSYMPPEQAWGKTDIGPLADVYSLGAVLYTLLTGRPPFLGTTALETVMQLRKDEPVAPSRLQSGVPRDLETICLKALEKEPAARYVSAAALAEDLARYLDGEPIVARPVGRLERSWRWCRRNPALAASCGAVLALALCLMIGGPLSAAMIYEQKEQAVAARQDALDNEQQAIKNAGLARVNETLARENEREAQRNALIAGQNAELARQRLGQAVEAFNLFVEQAQDQLKDLPQTQNVRLGLLRTAMTGLDRLVHTGGEDGKTDLVVARAHGKMGDVLLETGLAAEAGQQYQKTHEIVQKLSETIDPAKPHVPHLNLGRSYVNLGKAARRKGDAQAAMGYFLQSLNERQQALRVMPPDANVKPDRLFVEQEIADAYGHLVETSLDLGQPDDALEYFREGVELRRAWLNAAPNNSQALREFAGAQLDLANTSVDLGRLDDAIEAYADALETLRKVAQADGDAVSSRGNIGHAYSQRAKAWLFRNDFEQARAGFQEAVAVFEQLAKDDAENAMTQGKLASASYGLAVACAELNDGDTASENIHRCLEIRRRLAETEPDDLMLQAGLVLILARAGEHEQAAQLAEQVEQRASTDASLLYVAAGGYALASAAVDGTPAQAEQYARRAVVALQKAVDLGYRGIHLIRMDPDLDPLRERPDFERLVKSLQQPPAAKPDQTAGNSLP